MAHFWQASSATLGVAAVGMEQVTSSLPVGMATGLIALAIAIVGYMRDRTRYKQLKYESRLQRFEEQSDLDEWSELENLSDEVRDVSKE